MHGRVPSHLSTGLFGLVLTLGSPKLTSAAPAPEDLGAQPIPQDRDTQARTIQAGREAYAAGDFTQAYLAWMQVHPLVLADVTAPTHGAELEILALDLISACEAMAFAGSRACLSSTRTLAEQTVRHVEEHGCAESTRIRARVTDLDRLVPPPVGPDDDDRATQSANSGSQDEAAKPRRPGVGLMIAGGATAGAGLGVALLGLIGYGFNSGLCNSSGPTPAPCGEGRVSSTMMIAGGVVVLVGVSLLAGGAIWRSTSKRRAPTARIAPVAGPDLSGLVITGRF